MKFTKMHGLGNDYLYIDCFQENISQPEKIARVLCDRHFGVGGDGIILIAPSEIADFKMIMYNADGSQGEMCGNGIRCVGKYVYDKGLTNQKKITIETLAGIKYLEFTVENQRVSSIKVSMGNPILEPEKIPVQGYDSPVINQEIQVDGKTYHMTCVSMGNPHCVIFTDEPVEQLPLEIIGPKLEHHKIFPKGVNVEFVNIINENELKMRVWERGTGETMACGTGACAVAAAGVLNHYSKEQVTIHLSGGDLEIFWDRENQQLYMTGTATEVYQGQVADSMMEWIETMSDEK